MTAAECYQWINRAKATVVHNGKFSRWTVTVWQKPTAGPCFTATDINLETAIQRVRIAMAKTLSERRWSAKPIGHILTAKDVMP